jgi:CRP-like cAMP-binding protein
MRKTKQGAEADAFYVIESGTCVVYNSGREDEPLMTLKPGAYFGELGLLRDERRAANVRAISDVGLLSLSKAAFRELMGPLLAQLEERAAAYAKILRGYSKTGRARRRSLRAQLFFCRSSPSCCRPPAIRTHLESLCARILPLCARLSHRRTLRPAHTLTSPTLTKSPQNTHQPKNNRLWS